MEFETILSKSLERHAPGPIDTPMLRRAEAAGIEYDQRMEELENGEPADDEKKP